MMYTALLVAAAAIASAQVTYNSTTGAFTCPANNPNGAFCAGDSLTTNIIIRCNNGVGQPGNCNDNLDGYFPIGDSYSPCWQTSNTTGDAACSKNCIVEGSSGNYNGVFTLPNCTPSSASSVASSTSTSVSTTSASASVSTTSGSATSTSSPSTTITSTPSSTLSTFTMSPSGGSTVSSNGTITSASTSASKTPTGPTTTSSGGSQFTGAANAIGASSGAGLAGIGLLIAYFL